MLTDKRTLKCWTDTFNNAEIIRIFLNLLYLIRTKWSYILTLNLSKQHTDLFSPSSLSFSFPSLTSFFSFVFFFLIVFPSCLAWLLSFFISIFLVCFCLSKMTRGTMRQKIKTVLAPMVQKVVNHLESQNRCIPLGKSSPCLLLP